MSEAYIYDAIRTPRGKAKASGGLHDLTPMELLSVLYQALEKSTELDPARVREVILGCVTQHGEQAGNIAKSSAAFAGWPSHIGGLTINRFCSSGLDAVNLAALKVEAGQDDVVVAGGVEMMSRVPMLSDGASIFSDPKVAERCGVLMMGSGADLIASLNGFSRKEVDAVALESQKRAAVASEAGWFDSIVPVDNEVKGVRVERDECIREGMTEGDLEALAPAFEKLGAAGVDAVQLAAHSSIAAIDHVHTAGNSPAMADAAALVLVGARTLEESLNRPPRARIVATVSANDAPTQVLTGCIAATGRLMQQKGLEVDDVDLFEIHEAFAATILKCQRDLAIPSEKLNVNGGVIAMGHPMGATGAIMLGTLIDELERRDLTRGVVATSGAVGAGVAMLVERV